MNQRDDLDRMLRTWLDDPFTLPAPGYLGEVLDRTRQMRQRPSWASLERWLPMSIALRRSFVPMPAVLAMIGLLIVLAILASLSLVPFLAGVLGPTGTASAPGLIAFTRDGDIYVADSEPGSEPRAIVSGPTEDVGPLWSPDGRQLLFFRIAPEGETPMLTDADGPSPSHWSTPRSSGPTGSIGHPTRRRSSSRSTRVRSRHPNPPAWWSCRSTTAANYGRWVRTPPRSPSHLRDPVLAAARRSTSSIASRLIQPSCGGWGRTEVGWSSARATRPACERPATEASTISRIPPGPRMATGSPITR